VTQALPGDVDQPAPTQSPSVEINFYLDTTQSIRGFLHQPPGKANYFRDVLDKVGGILAGTWDRAEPHFWGFGGPRPEPIEIRNYLSPEAFGGTRTFIDHAITHEPPQRPGQTKLPRVKIVITDLFQDHNDMDRLAVDLSRTLDDPSRAVGMLAIRNPFDGAIDDLPGGQTLPRGAAESLPFYMLMIGPVADVTHCVREFSTRLGMDELPTDQKLAIVFGRHTVSRLQRKLLVVPAEKRPGYSPKDSKVRNARELGIPYLADVRRDLHLSIKNECPDTQLNQLGAYMRISRTPVLKAFRWAKDGWTEGTEPAAAVSIAGGLAVDGRGCMQGDVRLDRSRLQKNAVYLFQIQLTGERTDFANLGAWFVDLKDLPDIVDKGAYKDKVGKTPNLRHLLQTLSSKMFESQIPLARYYFYVETE
jgi:hypothetical protein